MSIENLQKLENDVSCALSGLNTLILAYGFNAIPMHSNSKSLLPMYGNQIADMLGIVSRHLTSASALLKEARNNE